MRKFCRRKLSADFAMLSRPTSKLEAQGARAVHKRSERLHLTEFLPTHHQDITVVEPVGGLGLEYHQLDCGGGVLLRLVLHFAIWPLVRRPLPLPTHARSKTVHMALSGN